MGLRVMVVQHGDKERLPGDPGLTTVGHGQARLTARGLATSERPVTIWSSPMRRALETAAPIAEEFSLEVVDDPRLRERMNWSDAGQESIEEFLDDWQLACTDRSYRPRSGDSSSEAAKRFLADLRRLHPAGTAIVVAHGGVTADALRTLIGDDEMMSRAPTLIDDGVPSCAITTLVSNDATWSVDSIATTGHLSRDSSQRRSP